MKKVKIMLSAVAVIAIVSGALAFKSNKFNTYAVYTTTSQGTCGTTLGHFKDGNSTDPLYYTSTVSGGNCQNAIRVKPE